MAIRPWILPQDVKNYTESKEIQGRSDEKLKFDIARAEQKVIKLTNNTFEDEKKYPQIPEPVKMATILIAEVYAKNAVEKGKKQYKSETYDDYSYVAADSSAVSMDDLNLDELLADYVLEAGIGKIVMKLRSL